MKQSGDEHILARNDFAAAAAFFVIFTAAISTHILLGAPREECGCCGARFKREGVAATLIGDILLGGASLWLVRYPASRLSLDGWLEAKGW